jgi:Tol biopolymer transport system component/DNA-binding winged helix-turn-helix (wHTH) protein
MSFWFGEFELDQERRQLLRSGEPVPLEPKAYELLSLLLERRPRALSRAQIRDVIWAGTYVSESTLGVVVNGIRQALGDDARQPRFIRTVRGFGFAFCGEAGESPAERPQAGEARVATGVEAPESAPPEVKSADGTASGRRAAAPAAGWRMAIIGAGVVVLVVAGWIAVRRRTSSDAPAGVMEPTVVPLTSFRGAELHPALSPDGTRVAFVWHGPDRENFDVYFKEISSGEMVRVTQDRAPDFSPVWSPDGKHLAFLRWHETEPAVFVVSPGGGHERRLAYIATPLATSVQMWLSSLDWSADGRFLAVADRATGSSSGVVLVSVETGRKQMLTANAEANTTEAFPAFSLDGRRLAFLRGRPDLPTWELLIQPLSTATPPRARGDAAVIKGVTPGDIAWLSSGDELVVGGQRVSLDGKPPRPLHLPGRMSTAEAVLTNIQRVSVRGAKLAFDTAELRPQLLRVPLGGAPASFAPFFPSTRGQLDPAVAPDGKRVAFASFRSGDGHIWIGEADGSACRELAHPPGAGYAGSPRWSPDGRRLAFDAQVAGTYHVYVTAPEGGTLRRLTSEQTSGARPRWSRDGRFIYFASTRSGDWQLWKTPADEEDEDTAAVQVTRSGGMEAEESPDGRYLYYAKREAPGVFRLSLQAQGTPDEEKVLDFGGEGLWQLTPRGMLVLDLQSGSRPAIHFHDLATRTTSVVLELTVPPEWQFLSGGVDFAVSPDERWALIVTAQAVESDIMLLDGFR